MRRWHGVVSAAAAACLAATLGGPVASADSPAPAARIVMPGGVVRRDDPAARSGEFLVCQGSWSPADVPFPPNDKWLSVGPAMTLHGEGMQPQPEVRAVDRHAARSGDHALPSN